MRAPTMTSGSSASTCRGRASWRVGEGPGHQREQATEDGTHHGETEGAVDLGQRDGDGLVQRQAHAGGLVGLVRGELAALGELDEVDEDLGVGVGLQRDAVARHELAQVGEVLQNAVMHYGDAAAGADVGVGVDVVGRAVRRPPRVRNAAWPPRAACSRVSGRSGKLLPGRGRETRTGSLHIAVHRVAQVGHLPLLLAQVQVGLLVAMVVHHAHTGRVVAWRGGGARAGAEKGGFVNAAHGRATAPVAASSAQRLRPGERHRSVGQGRKWAHGAARHARMR